MDFNEADVLKVSRSLLFSAIIEDESGRNAYYICRHCRASVIVDYPAITAAWEAASEKGEDPSPDPSKLQMDAIRHREDCSVEAAKRLILAAKGL